jgi:hypothetical protein
MMPGDKGAIIGVPREKAHILLGLNDIRRKDLCISARGYVP